MIREVKFESQDRRMKQILAALKEHGISLFFTGVNNLNCTCLLAEASIG